MSHRTNQCSPSHLEKLEQRRLLSVSATAEATGDNIMVFHADIEPLNSAYGQADVKGTATFTLDQTNPMKPTLRAQVNATGLQDLSAIPGAVHLAHIHGQFAGNREEPLKEQLDGPFFEGEGGVAGTGYQAIKSFVPTPIDDGDRLVDEEGKGLSDQQYLDFFEGLPDYGPVVMNLPNQDPPAPPSGTSPTEQFVMGVQAGTIKPTELFPNGTEFNLDQTYTFDLNNIDDRRQFNNTIGENGSVLDDRVLVLHGFRVPTNISDAIDTAAGVPAGNPQAGVPLGNGQSFRIVAPAAAGVIRASKSAEEQMEMVEGVFMVPGTEGADVSIPVSMPFRDGMFKNEVGYFVTGADGSMNGVKPGDADYINQVFDHAGGDHHNVLFKSGSQAGATATINAKAGDHLVFYIVQDGTHEQFRAENANNAIGKRNVFFSVDANPDGLDHAFSRHVGAGITEVAFEDLTGLGDRDYDDVVIHFAPGGGTSASATQDATNAATDEDDTEQTATAMLFSDRPILA